MTPERWRQISGIFHAARQRAAADRSAFLADACGDDHILHTEVNRLLSAAEDGASFGSMPIEIPSAQLQPGSLFGCYRIESLLGAGGMGEVYRARDTKLNRDVALKVLPDSFSLDLDRVARFKREAQVLASLNHQNIAAIYGVDESGGAEALAMELVDGPTLAERLLQGPIPLREGLQIATQIVDALEAAHEQGIVHRDLKPANVKVRSDGTVKLLDFGLAKAMATPGHAADTRPAEHLRSTQPGVIVGTPAYMSPEQARGLSVDHRTDIWSFGCVLFEILTGQCAYGGEELTEPVWTSIPADVPASIRLLVQHCLTADRRTRISHISTARFVINQVALLAQHGTTRASRPNVPIGIAAAAVLTAGATVAYAVIARMAPIDPQTQRVSILLPAGRSLAYGWTPGASLAVSPDGTKVAYLSGGAGRRLQLEVRSLDSLSAREFSDTSRARQPFFSPDGESVAFFTPTELRQVSLRGGNPVVIADNVNGGELSFGVWLQDNTIVFGGGGTGGLRRVSAGGGPVTQLTTLNGNETGHYPIAYVADATAILFNVRDSGLPSFFRLDAVILPSGERRTVLPDGWGLLAGRHLLMFKKGADQVSPFDRARLAVVGSPAPLVDQVMRVQSSIPQIAVSQSGALVYAPAPTMDVGTLGRLSSDGTFEPIPPVGRPGQVGRPRVSPDGNRIAFELRTPTSNEVFIFDVVSRTARKLTQGAFEGGVAWRPDGGAVAVSSVRPNGRWAIVLKELDGTDQILFASDDQWFVHPSSWSSEGRILAFTYQKATQLDIWLFTNENRSAAPYIASPAAEYSPAFSPNGHWLAYVSDQSGRVETYVRRFPDGEPRLVSTSGGGYNPVWRRDGGEIFYTTSTPFGVLMAVSVEENHEDLRLGTPRRVLNLTQPESETGYAGGDSGGADYDILPDGRFVVVRRRVGSVREIVLVQHWFTELERTVPARLAAHD